MSPSARTSSACDQRHSPDVTTPENPFSYNFWNTSYDTSSSDENDTPDYQPWPPTLSTTMPHSSPISPSDSLLNPTSHYAVRTLLPPLPIAPFSPLPPPHAPVIIDIHLFTVGTLYHTTDYALGGVCRVDNSIETNISIVSPTAGEGIVTGIGPRQGFYVPVHLRFNHLDPLNSITVIMNAARSISIRSPSYLDPYPPSLIKYLQTNQEYFRYQFVAQLKTLDEILRVERALRPWRTVPGAIPTWGNEGEGEGTFVTRQFPLTIFT